MTFKTKLIKDDYEDIWVISRVIRIEEQGDILRQNTSLYYIQFYTILNEIWETRRWSDNNAEVVKKKKTFEAKPFPSFSCGRRETHVVYKRVRLNVASNCISYNTIKNSLKRNESRLEMKTSLLKRGNIKKLVSN